VKPKIAICISGQTRGVADTSALVRGFDKVKDLFDIDFFGHTWTDQVAPSNITDFRNFQHTDQDEIWHQFKGDIFNMIPFNESWNEHPAYIKLLNGDGNFSEFAKSRVNGVFGQIVSNYKCIEQINASEYVAVIRWRWDNILRNKNSPNEFINDLRDFVEQKNIHNNHLNKRNEPIGVSYNMRIGSSPSNTFIDDQVFLFRANHVNQLVGDDVYQTLRNVYKFDNANYKDINRLHSHALWAAYFVESNFTMLPCLTEWTGFAKQEGPRTESLLNKEWNN